MHRLLAANGASNSLFHKANLDERRSNRTHTSSVVRILKNISPEMFEKGVASSFHNEPDDTAKLSLLIIDANKFFDILAVIFLRFL